MKMFSALSFIGLIFGGTIFGFSFKIVGNNQVGYYYTNETSYVDTGIYFQFPWTKEEMKIANVGREFLRLDHLTVVVNKREFMIQNTNVIYNVSDVARYIQTLKDVKSPVYCQTEIENAVIDSIVRIDPEKIPSLKELKNIPVPCCGITIERAVIGTKKNPLFVNSTQHPHDDDREEVTTPKPTTTTNSTTTTTQKLEEKVTDMIEEPDTSTNSTTTTTTTTTQRPEEEVTDMIEEPDTSTNSTTTTTQKLEEKVTDMIEEPDTSTNSTLND
jgi:hypothetical protein